MDKTVPDMIKTFITYLRNIKGYSDNTCKSYEKDLLDFATWVSINEPSQRWSTIDRTVIDHYIVSQAKRGLKPATTNRRLAAISAIYNYWIREGKLTENPCRYESRRKMPHTLPNTIDRNELYQAYSYAQGEVKMMLEILYTTGIRIQELLDMTWADINLETGELKITGKGAKDRIVYLNPHTILQLETIKPRTHNLGHLFDYCQRDVRTMIYYALKPYCHAKQLSPHAIRHTYATNMAKGGVNVSTIAGLLGHDSIKTTQKYIDMTQQNYRQAAAHNSLL